MKPLQPSAGATAPEGPTRSRAQRKKGRFWFHAAAVVGGAALIAGVLIWGANGPLLPGAGAPTVRPGYWHLSDWMGLGAIAVLLLGVPCAALLAIVGLAHQHDARAPWWIAAFLLGALALKAIGWYREAAGSEQTEGHDALPHHQTSPEVAAELDALVSWKVPETLLPYNRMQASQGFWMPTSQVFPDTSAFGAAPFHCVQQKDHLPKESQAAQRAFAKFLAYFDETNDADLSDDEEKKRLRLIQAAIKAGSWRAELSYWLWVANTGMRGDLERSRRVSAELLRMAQGRNPAIVAAAAAQVHDDADGQPTLNSLLRSGLERGSPQVMTSVGGRLAINVPKHRARGLAMLRCAAEQGDVEAYHPLGLAARLEGRWVDAYRIFELGANQGCTRCAEALGPLARMRLGFPGSPHDPTGHTPEISSLSAFYTAQFFWQITGLTDLRRLAPPSIQVNLGHEQVMGLIGLEMKESGLKPAPR